jgi:hypothetical protein
MMLPRTSLPAWLLIEQTNRIAGKQFGLAGEPVVLSGHDPQQRRLAGSVVAEHTDLGAVEEGERDVAQDVAIGRYVLGALVHLIDEVGHRPRG